MRSLQVALNPDFIGAAGVEEGEVWRWEVIK